MESLEAIVMLHRLWVCLVYQTKVCEYENHVSELQIKKWIWKQS